MKKITFGLRIFRNPWDKDIFVARLIAAAAIAYISLVLLLVFATLAFAIYLICNSLPL
jgi:hypothetical protein